MKARTLIMLSSAIEIATGIALVADRDLVARVLLGAGLSASGTAVGRVAGCGLLSLGLACWPDGGTATPRITRAFFTYNLIRRRLRQLPVMAGVRSSCHASDSAGGHGI
jgi:hypothetical protein